MPTRTNHAPIAVISVSPEQASEPAKVAFSADASRDADGDSITSYDLSFSDGFRGEGRTVTHVYQRAGSYLVRLAVLDGEEEASDTLFVDVAGAPGLECQPIFQYTDSSTGEFTARVRLENAGTSMAQLNGGAIYLSRPVSVISADDGTGIVTSESTTAVDFSFARTLSPGAQHSFDFSGVLPDADSTYFTRCTLC